MTHPTSNLLRAYIAPEAVELRAAAEGDGNTLTGHFAVFNQWTEINSAWEGQFMERIAPGAFARAFERAADVKVLFDHGHDPSIGNKPLGIPAVLREDKTGAYYEVPLLKRDDGTHPSYIEDLKPGLEAGAYGASFRFSVAAESWEEPGRATKANPGKLPERTISDVNLYEFGPVTFPAYAGATAGMRSLTDEFYTDPQNIVALTERVGAQVARKILDELAGGRSEPEPPAADGADTAHALRRRAFVTTFLSTP